MEFLNSIGKIRYYLQHVRFSVWLSMCFIVFAIGTTVGFAYGRIESSSLILLALAALAIGGFIVLLVYWKNRLFRFTLLFLLFFLGGVVRAIAALPVTHLDSWKAFEGIVSGFPAKVNESEYQYRVSVAHSSLKISIVSSRRAEYGDKVRVTCRLVSLEDDGDFQFWQLRAKGIEAHCKRDAFIEVVEKKENRFFAALASVKNTSRTLLEQALPEPESSLALGILVGERGERESSLNTAMRRVGLSHISVVSGFNVLIIAQVIFPLFFFFGFHRPYAFVASVCMLIVFTLFIGLDASILRAVIMFVAMQIVYFFGRPRLGFYVICLTAFVMLLNNPFLIRNVGFLLSFASVAGMSLTAGFWGEVVKKLPDTIRSFAISTLSAQSGALPVVIWYFGTVSALSLLVNVIVLPLIPFAMAASFAVVLLSLVGIGGAGWIAYPLLTSIVHVAEWFSRVSFVQFTIRGLWGRVAFLFILVGVYLAVSLRNRWLPLLKSRFQKHELILKEEGVKEVIVE